MIVACSLATVVAVLLLVVAEWRTSASGCRIAKPIASAGFVATAVAAGAPGSRFGLAILVALVLSFAGDLFLLSSGKRLFLAGLGSFLLGHVAYAAGFLLRGVAPAWTAIGLLAAASLALPILRWLLPHVGAAGMRGPVIAYVVVITAMVGLATGTVGAHGNPWLLVAAVAFFCSDLSVARDRFVAPGFVNRAWGLPLYYFAQLLFGWAILAG